MGRCGPSMGLADNSGNSYVCCLFDVTCGGYAAERFVYFRNPNYPATFDQSRMCRARVGKLDKGICQIRLDLLNFDVAKPLNGNCSYDMFVVSGQNENYVIPKICGLNDGQHYYVGVDESGVITLHMMMRGPFYRRSFEILITQIPCRSEFSAPAHCLQYFVGTHGSIKSFNYEERDQMSNQFSMNSYNDLLQEGNSINGIAASGAGISQAPYGLAPMLNLQLNQRQSPSQHLQTASRFGSNQVYGQLDQSAGYPNDLDYTICIKKESGFCSITYQLSRSEQGLQQPFAIGQSTNWLSQSPNDSSFTSERSQWYQMSNECRDDYLLIGGSRFCSGTSSNSQLGSNDGSFSSNGTNLAAGQQIQQLQNQYNYLMQQLARLQQAAANSSSVNPNNPQQQVHTTNGNIDPQQVTIAQQALLIQQQLQTLLSNAGNGPRFPQINIPSDLAGQSSFQTDSNHNSPGTIITDTTSGPFLLRFVSNYARNARGFHIDYRQNPCK